MDRLREFINALNATVGDAVGRRLNSVFYGTLKDECTAQQIAAGIGFFGGEVELLFESTEPIFLSWGENDGWNDHFSLAVRRITSFRPGTLVRHSAASAPEWSACLGSVLVGAECRASGSTPHLLVLRFEPAAVVVADGHQLRMGDGDDLIIRRLERADLLEFPELVWALGATAV